MPQRERKVTTILELCQRLMQRHCQIADAAADLAALVAEQGQEINLLSALVEAPPQETAQDALLDKAPFFLQYEMSPAMREWIEGLVGAVEARHVVLTPIAEMAVHAPSEVPPTGPSITESKFAANEHNYPGIVAGKFVHTSNCANGCGAWMGGSRSGGPNGVDPFGKCPMVLQNDAPHTAEFAPDHEPTADDAPRSYGTTHRAPTPPNIPEGAIMVTSSDLDKPLPHLGGRKKTDMTAQEWALSTHFLAYMKKPPFNDWTAEEQTAKRDAFILAAPQDLRMNRWGARFSKFCGVP